MGIKLINLLVKDNVGKEFEVCNYDFGGEKYTYSVNLDGGVYELLDQYSKEITLNNKTITMEFKEIGKEIKEDKIMTKNFKEVIADIKAVSYTHLTLPTNLVV